MHWGYSRPSIAFPNWYVSEWKLWIRPDAPLMSCTSKYYQ